MTHLKHRPKFNFINNTGFDCVVPPFDINIDIDDEDSLSERFSNNQCTGIVDIAVIKLPRISNFTDFNVFENFGGVSLRYVDKVKDLGKPDIIFIPGTKNTIKDLMWMRQNGIEALIKKHKLGILEMKQSGKMNRTYR